jgi:hypothetical protein
MEADLLTPFALGDRLPLQVAFAVWKMLLRKRKRELGNAADENGKNSASMERATHGLPGARTVAPSLSSQYAPSLFGNHGTKDCPTWDNRPIDLYTRGESFDRRISSCLMYRGFVDDVGHQSHIGLSSHTVAPGPSSENLGPHGRTRDVQEIPGGCNLKQLHMWDRNFRLPEQLICVSEEKECPLSAISQSAKFLQRCKSRRVYFCRQFREATNIKDLPRPCAYPSSASAWS